MSIKTRSVSEEYRVGVLGAGSWGTTLAVLLTQKERYRVTLWSPFKEHVLAMRSSGYNKDFLNIRLPEELYLQWALKEVVVDSDILVLALPVRYVSRLLSQIKKSAPKPQRTIFVNVAKGIDTRSLQTVGGMFRKTFKDVPYAVLSGPNIAKEVLEQVPSVAVAASGHKKTALLVQELFSTPRFRVYSHDDTIGVELAGALKNVIALACGISDGLGFGTNTKAALVSRGLAEMTRLGKALKASTTTFSGVAGMGDLVTTCFSPFSRNRTVGEQIAQGKSLAEVVSSTNMVAEGIDSVKAAHALSKKYHVPMPITEQVYQVLYRKKPALEAVKDLMLREKKVESE